MNSDDPAFGPFLDLVARWNAKVNLVSRRDMTRLRSRHVADSLSVAPYLKGELIADAGAGGGFPGVPLAIAHPQMHFTLIERSERKARFLAQVQIELGLENVNVLCEDVARVHGAFDTIVSRGLGGPAKVWALTSSALREGGRLVHMSTTRPDSAPSGGMPGAEIVCVPVNGGVHQLAIVEKP